MKKFIFTFPENHPLRNHYQPVIAKSAFAARSRMFERYGSDWAFMYTEAKANRLGIVMTKRELAPMYVKEKDLQACQL